MNKRIAIILAAGLGSRLGRPHPKSLTPIAGTETILSRQVRLLRQHGLTVCIVVGFKLEQIMEAEPDVLFAYNPNFDTTNTAKSLLFGLRNFRGRDVIWLNGDVVFDEGVLGHLLGCAGSFVAGNHASVAEEEVKYQVDENGYITSISKQVTPALGEAVGINGVAAADFDAFFSALEDVADDDYFERAIELQTQRKGPVFKAVDISAFDCMEVDFAADLENARAMLSR